MCYEEIVIYRLQSFRVATRNFLYDKTEFTNNIDVYCVYKRKLIT